MYKSKYVLVIGEGRSYYDPFRRFGVYSSDQNLFAHPEHIALVLFTGGADISASLYCEREARRTSTFVRRDIFELVAFRRANKLGLPIAGVCRGAQFLCAMAGGKLIQHVTGHEGWNHRCRTWDDRTLDMSSTHHQMMLPPESAMILAWADPSLSREYIGGEDIELEEPEREVEVAYFPNINAVGMQYHPECMPASSHGFRFASEVVETFLLNTVVKG